MQTNIEKNIDNIKRKINSACKTADRDPEKITLIAVSKRKSHKMIQIAHKKGINNFGENYAQELQKKASIIGLNNIVWHFIGPIQSNKVKIIAKNADWVHTIDREKIIRKLDLECGQFNKTINACIQINISSEESKSGCNPKDVIDIAKLIESMKNINLRGIMALPKITDNEIKQKEAMQSIMALSKKLQSSFPDAACVSLGTTHDFRDALIYGSTMIRVGESIFGKRQ
tara:strand:+ start:6846 stop:7532 length:687 start_codon:yes stop_codon:yes gene_type:complete